MTTTEDVTGTGAALSGQWKSEIAGAGDGTIGSCPHHGIGLLSAWRKL